MKHIHPQPHFMATDTTSSESTPLLHTTVSLPAPQLEGEPEQPAPPSNSNFGLQAFLADIRDPHNGTVPVSVLIATIIGISTGILVTLYYAVLYALLDLVWKTIPESLFAPYVPSNLHWLWIPIVILPLSIFVGLPVRYLGDPGDLKVTVGRVHRNAYVPLSWGPPMILASLASIVGAGSLGPEAPLITICATIAGWVSRSVFAQRYKNLIRRHTLCGMACATAAFFGVPLGGALFALEVNSRNGLEYFEHALVSIYSGTVCLAVFRGLSGLEIGPVWKLTASARGNAQNLVETNAHPPVLVAEISASSSSAVVVGCLLGVVGAIIAACFARGHKAVVRSINSVPLFNSPIPRAILGGFGICAIGLAIPQSLFWGEYELEKIAVAADSVRDLPHLWPKGGLTGLEITGFWSALLVGVAKLAAVSITVASGYRGGFIFPFFTAGAAFGRAACYLIPSLHPVVAVLCIGAAINASITRTALATPLILAALSGEPNTGPPLLAASLVATFVTTYLPFITEQRGRDSLLETQLYSYTLNNIWTGVDVSKVMDESDESLSELPNEDVLNTSSAVSLG